MFHFVHFHFSSNVRVTAAILPKNIFSTKLNTINTQKIRKHIHTYFSKTFWCYVWYEKQIKLIRIYINMMQNLID